MKTLLLFITALLFSCNSDEKYDTIEESEVNSSILKTNPLFNSNKDALPESLKTIAKSIKIEGEHYSFNLSIDEAQRLGATKKEYNDIIEAVKYLNQELDKTKEEGGIIQMSSGKEKTTSSLSRGSGKYTTFDVLYSSYNVGTLQSLNANFTGPKTIVAEAGAASLSWSARFNEASKGISFALSGFLISSYEEREVTAPLSIPGQKTSWGWNVNCGMGDGAHGYVLFKTPNYDPVNTLGSDDDLFNLPSGFDLRCDDYYNHDYSIQFQNYSGYSCSYEITEYLTGGFPRKGSFPSGERVTMFFSKDRTYILKLKDSRDYTYEYSWNLSSRVQL